MSTDDSQQQRLDLSQSSFTLLRQTNQLVAAQEADPDLGFVGAHPCPVPASPAPTLVTARSMSAAMVRMRWL